MSLVATTDLILVSETVSVLSLILDSDDGFDGTPCTTAEYSLRPELSLIDEYRFFDEA